MNGETAKNCIIFIILCKITYFLWNGNIFFCIFAFNINYTTTK
jgi:hypothetical protein